jgi:LysM repeat protein
MLKRILALAALALAIILIFVIVSGNTGDDSDSGKGGKQNVAKTKPKTTKKVYVVKDGDTLTAIAHSTGIGVTRIQKLNPDLDPQALQSGQKLKLR